MDDKEVKDAPVGLLRSSALVGLMTMLSRVLGLLRDVALATYLGAAANADAFFIAFKIPNFLRRLFAEGAFSQAFVPVLSEYRTLQPHAAVQLLVNKVAASLGGSVLMLTGLVVMGAPWVVYVFAPGFSDEPEKLELTASLLRITFPYLAMISLAGFGGAILNSYGRFAIPAITPVLLNLSLIGAAVWFAPHVTEPTFALAWGVFVAGCAQLLFQLPFLYRLELLPKPQWDWGDEGVKRILKLMVPAMFGVSVSQINLLLDTVLASFLPTGSVSWLYFSDRLSELPLGVFAIAVSTVILPSLSRDHAGADSNKFSATLDWAIRMVALIALPAMVALVVLAEPILMTLFQYGEMNGRDVAMSALSLRAYAVGLLAFMLIKVLAPGYYSRQDTATPVRIGIYAMAANMVLNIVLVVPLHMYYQVGHVGLALATSLAAWLNAILLWRGLVKKSLYIRQPGFISHLGKLLTAVVVMTLGLWMMMPLLGDLLAQAWWQRSMLLLAVCAVGAIMYFLCLFILGLRPRNLSAPG
ncbi:MAG: murein biosynthesis integral membrane protein MurJ [Pseudomonadales bacterium]